MRKIFQNIKELNWINYLIELFIVFFGISLAFYVNKQADIRKSLQKEKFYLTNIKNDLMEDEAEIHTIIDLINEELKTIQNLGNHIRDKNPDLLDSIVNPAVKLSYTSNYHPDLQTYQSLTQNGEVLKISNIQLRNRLDAYYSYYETLSARHDDFSAVKKNKLFPFLSIHYNFYKKEVIDKQSFYSDQLQNIIFELFKYSIAKKNTYQKILKENVNLKKEVEIELEKLR